MSIQVKKAINIKINGKDISVPEGTVVLDAAKRNDISISNLCSSPKLKPFAACRTCMVEVRVDGEKELVYSCTHPVAEGMEISTNTEETDRYNKACLEMLLVEHPLDCPICDKSGVCPLQNNTDELQLYNGRFEINRRNEPSIKTNPIIEFYLNRCIMCGMCVRICDETQGVQALDFHKRGMSVSIGTANDEPLDCEFCGQCITTCPTGALMDLTSNTRGLAAMFKTTHSTCNFCSWGCTIKLETKKDKLARIEGDETLGVGINEGNLCAKGRFGHGIVQNDKRIKSPMINVGGAFRKISWEDAFTAIAERIISSLSRIGPQSIAGIGGEKLTNEENYLFQKLFRGIMKSNQVTNLSHLRAPYLNTFMLNCFQNGIKSKPITELENSDVVLIFNSDIPSEYPVAGNSIRKGAIFTQTDIIIANPRKVIFNNESNNETRLHYKAGTDLAVVNRICQILIENKIVNSSKLKEAVPNFYELASPLSIYTAEYTEQITGLKDEVLVKAAQSFGKDADRFIICGNDILDTGQGEEILNALLNLSTLVTYGSEGSVSIYPPREHCNSQGVNDMGVTSEFLPGYKSINDEEALKTLAQEWKVDTLKFRGDDLTANLWENCKSGMIKVLYIAGEDPVHSFPNGALVKEALNTLPFVVVQDVYMTSTAEMADIVLPSSTFAEKEGTVTNMSRHVQRVAPAIKPEGDSKTDFDIFHGLASALHQSFEYSSVEEVQEEIEKVAPIYKNAFPGDQSNHWTLDSVKEKPAFAIVEEEVAVSSDNGFPFKLITNNHMFHIGSYSRHAKALVDIGPDCIAQIHPEDAKSIGVQSKDKIAVESNCHKVELPVEVTPVTAKGLVYIPKNWEDVPVNLLRNGDKGLVSVKISKAN